MRVPRILTTIVTALALLASLSAQSSRQLNQLGMIDVPGRPGFDQLAFAKGMLLMTHTSASTVDVFDPVRRRVVAQVTGVQSPRGIAVDEPSGKVYVADAGSNSIAVIATDNWKVTDRIPVPTPPDALLLGESGNQLFWSDSQNGTVSLLDLTTRQTSKTVQLDGSPSYMALNPDQHLVYITLQDQRQVVAVDPQLQVTARIPLNASQPTGLLYDARTKCLYVAVRYAVLSLNTETRAEVNRVPAAAGVDMLWLDPETRTVFAAGNGSLLMLRANGQRLTVVDEIDTDVKGHTVAYDSERKMLFLPGGRDGRSKLLILRPVSPTQQQVESESAEAKVQ
jgi:YVTN family beta-propeller protein